MNTDTKYKAQGINMIWYIGEVYELNCKLYVEIGRVSTLVFPHEDLRRVLGQATSGVQSGTGVW